ncbi:VPLPA-CTERM sorting domain-containing protein [Methylomonas sp. MgM2]
MQKNIITTAALAALASVGGQASAAMTQTTTYNLNDFPTAVYGDANLTPTSSGLCSIAGDFGPCYGSGDAAPPGEPALNSPNYVVIGTVRDSSSEGAHIHNFSDPLDPANRMIHYHADSGGIYFRMRDQSAFSFLSMNIAAPSAGNPDPNGYWEILGFSDAINADLVGGDGTNYANSVAYQRIDQATFDYSNPASPFTLNSSFGDVSAVWIHYGGWGKVPYDPDLEGYFDEDTGEFVIISDGPLTTPEFNLYVDNITLSTPTAVPVPAAAWLFGSGLIGLISFGRKKVA